MKYLSYILIYIVAILFLPLFFAGIIPAGMEMGALAVLFLMYIINFICLTALLIVCIIQKNRDTEFYMSTSSLFLCGLLLVSVIDFSICKYNSRPYKAKTEQEIYVFYENEMNKFKAQYNKLLKKTNLFFPVEEQVNLDKEAIKSCLDNLLNQSIVEMTDTQDSIYKVNFANIFGINPYYVSNTDKSLFHNEIQQSIINSISLDFISYSPDFHLFIAIFTFNTSIEESVFDTVSKSLCLIGEKANNTVYMYPQRSLVYDYGNINKEAAFYNTMERLKKYDFFDGYKFWNNKTFFSVITEKNDYKFKFDEYNYRTRVEYHDKYYLKYNY